MSEPFPTYADPRGLLLPVDLDDVPFEVARFFIVVGPPEGSTRGGHVAPCQELVVLVDGTAVFRHDGTTTHLNDPGAVLLLPPGSVVEYDLAPGGATIVVLADRPYEGSP